MGLQITVLLSMVIYVDFLQATVPVFDAFGSSPNVLNFFIVAILMLCVCLLVSTHTLFIYNVSEYESKNFSKTEAKISIGLAKMFNAMSCTLWEIEIKDHIKGLILHGFCPDYIRGFV